MVKRMECGNCDNVYRDGFPGHWDAAMARAWFEDDAVRRCWARVDGVWFCPSCSRAARLAAEWVPSEAGTTG